MGNLRWSTPTLPGDRKLKSMDWQDAQQVKVPAVKAQDLNLIPRTHVMVEGENRLPQIVL